MCKHLNVSITEYGTAYTEHSFEGGRVTTSHNDVSDYTGRCFARCDGCGLKKSFNRYSKRLPLWLQERLAALEEA